MGRPWKDPFSRPMGQGGRRGKGSVPPPSCLKGSPSLELGSLPANLMGGRLRREAGASAPHLFCPLPLPWGRARWAEERTPAQEAFGLWPCVGLVEMGACLTGACSPPHFQDERRADCRRLPVCPEGTLRPPRPGGHPPGHQERLHSAHARRPGELWAAQCRNLGGECVCVGGGWF